MKFLFLLAFCGTFHTSLSIAISPEQSAKSPVRNANYIFNAIHSSMRQWGSSLNHNGMSFFLATVPEGTQFYHGTSKKERVEGMEWLAFEPEHSLVFARGRPPPGHAHPPSMGVNGEPHDFTPPPGHHSPPAPGDHGELPDFPPPPGHHKPPPKGRDVAPLQHPFHNGLPDGRPPPESSGGWLHTYRTRHPLRLLYVDGMSAGKTDNGTLDTQDLVLLNTTEPRRGMWEFERALGLCKMAQEEWEGRIDGIVRMEAGFEIILCDFSKDVDLVRATRVGGGGVRDRGGVAGVTSHFRYMEAVADRYAGIGGGRVRLDYEHFVSAFAYPLDLFREASETTGQPPLPRLLNVSSDNLAEIRSAVGKMVLEHDAVAAARESFDWQATADMIVARYSTPLQYLTCEKLANATLLGIYLEELLRPFIDYDSRDAISEAAHCAEQFTSGVPTAGTSLAAAAVHSIANSICTTLVSVLAAIPKDQTLSTAITQLDELVAYLQWPSWKQCRGCADDELCFVPLWPFGAVEDHKQPQCLNATRVMDRRGYWGIGRGGPPPPRKGEGEKGNGDM